MNNKNEKLSKEYLPTNISTLLIGECPPKEDFKYFYNTGYKSRDLPIESDNSLQATIFYHYFGIIPKDSTKYKTLLNSLKERKIFLIDILEEYIPIRNHPENIELLKDKTILSKLDKRIKSLSNENTTVVFLLARNSYLKELRQKFPNASFINWKCFRLDKREVEV